MKSSKKDKKIVYAYIHTHWDREWYREFEEFRIRLVEVFDDVLKKLEKNELDTFYFDGQTGALEDYLEIKAEKKDKIKKLIKDKRLFIGPYYCSTDSFLVDSESLIKNLQMGIKYAKEFGCEDFIAYHADTFGHSAHIPQIIKYFNIPNAIFWRGLGELESEFKFNDLKSTYLIEGYFHDYFSAPVSYEKKAEFLKRTLDRIAKYSSENLLLPIGADHLAAADKIKEQIREVNKLLDDYEIVLSTPFEYLQKVDNNYKKNIKHELRDTKRNFILPGVLSSRLDLKQSNARLQWELSRKTQPLQAIMSFLNKTKSFQKELDYTYKMLISNHPHDSIYGCSIDNVHKENKMRFEKVSQASHSIFNCVKRDLFKQDTISVVNLSNFEFNGALKIKTDKKLEKKYNAQLIGKTKGFPFTKIYRINEIPITEDYTEIYEYLIDLKAIKALSSQKISEELINKKSELKISDTCLQNDKIKLCVTDNKIEITDKKTNKKYSDFIKIIDRADVGDSYNFGALKDDKPIEAKIIKTKIKQQGHIRSVLEIDFEISIPTRSTMKARSKSLKKHIIKLFASLENQNDFIEFNAVWENKSKDHILQIKFNMEEKIATTYSDDLAGYVKRSFDTDYDIYKLLPAPRGIELKHNTAPMQKCLHTQGFGIITEGLTEYEIFKKELRLTILRATGTVSNPKNPTRGTPAGPPLPTPDLQMTGQNQARFAICFQKDISQMQPNVEKFFDTCVMFFADCESKSFFNAGNSNILLSTAKTDEQGNLILRFINKSDKDETLKFSTDLKNKGIYFTDAMENIKEPYSDKNICANSFITLMIKK